MAKTNHIHVTIRLADGGTVADVWDALPVPSAEVFGVMAWCEREYDSRAIEIELSSEEEVSQ